MFKVFPSSYKMGLRERLPSIKPWLLHLYVAQVVKFVVFLPMSIHCNQYQ